MGYPVLIDDIDDDDELSVVLSIVYESDSPNLHIPLERLQSKQGKGVTWKTKTTMEMNGRRRSCTEREKSNCYYFLLTIVADLCVRV